MPKPSCPDPNQVEVELVQQVQKLEAENRLDLTKNFKPVDSLGFLNELDFDEIEKIFNSLDD